MAGHITPVPFPGAGPVSYTHLVQGEAGFGVAQNAGQGLGVHAAGEGVSGKCMPQIVKSDLRQSSLLQDLFQLAVCSAGVQWGFRAKWVMEDPR